ncbi:unnamed protein product [Mesocestoides corti]|uniref:DUF4408 domain-containing protein n=1 Tax=Mesocestoides corti TaxID=53468 RepID=A0A0R3UK44_MESCO|nr:unnamed protein product [Mesocestoides corti]
MVILCFENIQNCAELKEAAAARRRNLTPQTLFSVCTQSDRGMRCMSKVTGVSCQNNRGTDYFNTVSPRHAVLLVLMNAVMAGVSFSYHLCGCFECYPGYQSIDFGVDYLRNIAIWPDQLYFFYFPIIQKENSQSINMVV